MKFLKGLISVIKFYYECKSYYCGMRAQIEIEVYEAKLKLKDLYDQRKGNKNR